MITSLSIIVNVKCKDMIRATVEIVHKKGVNLISMFSKIKIMIRASKNFKDNNYQDCKKERVVYYLLGKLLGIPDNGM